MNGKKEEDLLYICFIINASIGQWELSINSLLINGRKGGRLTIYYLHYQCKPYQMGEYY